MYRCKSWTIKEAECQRTDVSNCDAGKDSWESLGLQDQSILKEINPEYSLEGLMMKLKLQLWPPDAKSWLIGKDPDSDQDWRQKEKGAAEDKMVR